MNNIRSLLLFVAIFLLGVVLRFYQLGLVPASLNWDEVSWGYNAYSISQSARDEYGAFLPLSFRAFGDFKQPMYIYLDSVATGILGLTPFAVRLPSALFGSLTVISVFFLVRELFYKDRHRQTLSFLVMFLFAVSPWSIQFSRVAFEANIGVFFTITGIFLFLLGFRKQSPWILSVSSVVLSLSCYTYHSQKVFTPLLFCLLLFYAKDYLWKKKNILVLLLVVFFLANIIWIADARTTSRGRSVMFTSHQTEILASSTEQLIYDKEHHDLEGEVLHNRRLIYLDTYIENYLSFFDPNFLFINGDNPRHHPPFMGILYLFSFPFILLGVVMTIRTQKKLALLLFGWLLLAPVAAALAIDAPNASRSMVFLPTWQIFEALGIVSLLYWFKSDTKKKLFVGGMGFIYFFSIAFYIHNYFNHTDTEYASSWQYGYKEVVQFAASLPSQTRVFFASDVEQPYIFYLFYTKFDPQKYVSIGGSARIKRSCFMINNIHFGSCNKDIKAGDIYITTYNETPFPSNQIKTIELPNKDIAIRVYTVK